MIIIAIAISNRPNHTYHHPWTSWPFVCFVFCLARNNMNRAARYSPSNQCNVYLGFLVTSDHHDDDDAALVSRTIMMFHDGHTVCVQPLCSETYYSSYPVSASFCFFPHKHLCPAFTFTFFSLSLSTQYLPTCASFPTNIFAHLVYKIKAFIAFSFPQHPFHVASYCFLQKTIVFPLSLSCLYSFSTCN